MRRFPCAALLALLLAGCGGPHPLAGTWRLQPAAGQPPLELQFDAGSDRVLGHATRDGRHVHLSGSYRLDGEQVTITASWEDTGDGVQWSGQLAGDRLRLRDAANAELVFAHSDAPPSGH